MKLPSSKAHITDLIDVLPSNINHLEYVPSFNESFNNNSASKPNISNIKVEQSAEVFKTNVNNDKICFKCNKPSHIQKYCPQSSSSSDRLSYRSSGRGSFPGRNRGYNRYFRRARAEVMVIIVIVKGRRL